MSSSDEHLLVFWGMDEEIDGYKEEVIICWRNLFDA
jgi:hypothetical protein